MLTNKRVKYLQSQYVFLSVLIYYQLTFFLQIYAEKIFIEMETNEGKIVTIKKNSCNKNFNINYFNFCLLEQQQTQPSKDASA